MDDIRYVSLIRPSLDRSLALGGSLADSPLLRPIAPSPTSIYPSRAKSAPILVSTHHLSARFSSALHTTDHRPLCRPPLPSPDPYLCSITSDRPTSYDLILFNDNRTFSSPAIRLVENETVRANLTGYDERVVFPLT